MTQPALPPLAAGALALLVAWLAVWGVRAYSLRRGVLDVPNERSSHARATPRGGGLGIVVACLAVGTPALLAAGVRPIALAVAGLAVAAVAAVGWLDDHTPLTPRARLAVHVAAGLLVAAVADAWLPWAGAGRALVAAWWLVWTVSAINVVNFMDGIDGLIASQLALYAGYVALLAPTAGVPHLAALVVAGASLGFLGWNWPPARIFLGDVGSGALGVLAVLLGLGLVEPGAPSSVARAFLPLLPLFLDATVTLVRRARAGERLSVAHRSHLYQRLANGPLGHRRTTLAYLAAAAVGATLGLVLPEMPLLVTAAYGAGIAVVGAWVERRVPWRPAAVA